MRVERTFGHIPGYPEGSCFGSRAELSQAGLHRPLIAGISGRGWQGANSVVLSGGYEDDEDLGEVILYVGHGGRDPETGRQKAHQTLTRGNLALASNAIHGLPVRVIRGAHPRSPYAPEAGYRYDGLYRVEDYWCDIGKAGFYVWRYRLRKITGHAAPQSATIAVLPDTTRIRTVCDTECARQIKALYHYRCQMCGMRLETSAGPYAEAAHIRPLEVPHHGPDTPDNLLCLCPNHHVLFVHGGVAIADDLTLLGHTGRLRVDFRHAISREHLQYHREHYWLGQDLGHEIS
jgi:putative restriction endonuclease